MAGHSWLLIVPRICTVSSGSVQALGTIKLILHCSVFRVLSSIGDGRRTQSATVREMLEKPAKNRIAIYLQL